MVAGSTGGSLTMQTSRCPRCGDPIPGADINAQALVAVCRSCDVVHPLATTLEPVGTAVKAAPSVDLAETPPEPLMRLAGSPDGLAVQVENDVLSIRRTWWSWSPQNLFLAFWVFGWDLFLFVWYAGALGAGVAAVAGGDGAGAAISLLPILFPILHVAVGVFMTYRLACLVLNKTIVTVDDDHLSVRHGPLPAGDVEARLDLVLPGAFGGVEHREAALQPRGRRRPEEGQRAHRPPLPGGCASSQTDARRSTNCKLQRDANFK